MGVVGSTSDGKASRRARTMAQQDLVHNHRDVPTFVTEAFGDVHRIADARFAEGRTLRATDVRRMERTFGSTMAALSGSVPLTPDGGPRTSLVRWVVPVRHGGTLRSIRIHLAIKKKRWALTYTDGCTVVSRHALERVYDRTSASCAVRRTMAALADWEPVVRWLTHVADPTTDHAGLMVPTEDGWLEVGVMPVPTSHGAIVEVDANSVLNHRTTQSSGPVVDGRPTHCVAVAKTYISIREAGPKWRLDTHRALTAIRREEDETFRAARHAIVVGADDALHGRIERLLSRVSDVHDATPPGWRRRHRADWEAVRTSGSSGPALDLGFDQDVFRRAVDGFGVGHVPHP